MSAGYDRKECNYYKIVKCIHSSAFCDTEEGGSGGRRVATGDGGSAAAGGGAGGGGGLWAERGPRPRGRPPPRRTSAPPRLAPPARPGPVGMRDWRTGGEGALLDGVLGGGESARGGMMS